MLLFLVAVMGEDSGELLILAGVDPLVVPVDRLQFLLRRSVLQSVRGNPR
jgi:hypothetical protein